MTGTKIRARLHQALRRLSSGRAADPGDTTGTPGATGAGGDRGAGSAPPGKPGRPDAESAPDTAGPRHPAAATGPGRAAAQRPAPAGRAARVPETGPGGTAGTAGTSATSGADWKAGRWSDGAPDRAAGRFDRWRSALGALGARFTGARFTGGGAGGQDHGEPAGTARTTAGIPPVPRHAPAHRPTAETPRTPEGAPRQGAPQDPATAGRPAPHRAVRDALTGAARSTGEWFRGTGRSVRGTGDWARAARDRVRTERQPDRARTRQQRLSTRSRRLEAASVAAAVLLCLLVGALAPTPGSPTRTAQAAGTENGDGPGSETAGDGGTLGRSAPVRVRVPQIGIDVDVFGADLDPDGGPPTPAEEDAMRAAWYAGGVSPGEPGAALLVGHLDTMVGPAAFAGLGMLEPGAGVEVDREDGSTAVFIVRSVEQYLKRDFPDEEVYGTVDTPQLRLITCGGRWSSDDGYDANIVAYAELAEGAWTGGGDGADSGTDADAETGTGSDADTGSRTEPKPEPEPEPERAPRPESGTGSDTAVPAEPAEPAEPALPVIPAEPEDGAEAEVPQDLEEFEGLWQFDGFEEAPDGVGAFGSPFSAPDRAATSVA